MLFFIPPSVWSDDTLPTILAFYTLFYMLWWKWNLSFISCSCKNISQSHAWMLNEMPIPLWRCGVKLPSNKPQKCFNALNLINKFALDIKSHFSLKKSKIHGEQMFLTTNFPFHKSFNNVRHLFFWKVTQSNTCYWQLCDLSKNEWKQREF